MLAPRTSYPGLDETDTQRFWSQVLMASAGTDGCWFWRGPQKTSFAYRHEGKQIQVSAVRVAWVVTYGPLTPDQLVLHTCDNTSCAGTVKARTLCVNPSHLKTGTLADVEREKKVRGRLWRDRMATP